MVNQQLLLENLCLPIFSDYESEFFEPDTPSDPGYDHSYPHPVDYRFNSRGYRDHEWPNDISEIRRCIWCVGDSATVGIGSPFDHIWPQILGRQIGSRCINISMRAAGNQWISRQVHELLRSDLAKTIIVQWSFLHRRERTLEDVIDSLFLPFYYNVKDRKWPQIKHFCEFYDLSEFIQQEMLNIHRCDVNISDKKISFWDIVNQKKFTWLDEMRCLQHDYTSTEDDIDLTLSLIDSIEASKKDCKIIHCFIPNFVNVESIPLFQQQFKYRYDSNMVRVEQIDLARDGRHYDMLTSSSYANEIVNLL